MPSAATYNQSQGTYFHAGRRSHYICKPLKGGSSSWFLFFSQHGLDTNTVAECGVWGDCPVNTGISIIQVPIHPAAIMDMDNKTLQTLLRINSLIFFHPSSFLFHIHNTYINLYFGEKNYNLLQVRHPFERLVSAYRHLFLHGGWRLLDHSWEGDTEREEVSCDWWSLVT